MRQSLVAAVLAALFLMGCSNPASSSKKVTSNGGVAKWAATLASGSGSERAFFYGSATDKSGNLYAVGSTVGTVAFDFGNGIASTGIGSASAVVVKYSSSGAAQWARTPAGTGAAGFNAVAADSSGDIYAFGYLSGTGSFDFGNSVTAAGAVAGSNPVVVKYDTSGTALWAETLTAGAAGGEFAGGAVDASGNVYGVGETQGSGTYSFGAASATTGASGSNSVLVVKFSSTGSAQWAKSLSSGTETAVFGAAAVDSSGGLYAVGHSTGTTTVGLGNSITATGTETTGIGNILIVKYNTSDGTTLWARTLTAGTVGGGFYGVTTDAQGNVYAAGQTNGSEAFGFGNAVTAMGTDSGTNGNTLLVKYNSSGTAQWAQTLTAGTDGAAFNAVTVDGSSNVYAAGFTAGSGRFGFGNSVSMTGTASGTSANILIVKYNSSGKAQWARTQTAGSDAYLSGVAIESDKLYVVGDIDSTGSFSFGNSITAAGPGISNPVVVKYQ